MKFKNNWSAIKMSREQIKFANAAEKQKRLTAEELMAEGDRAYEEMQKARTHEAARTRKTLN